MTKPCSVRRLLSLLRKPKDTKKKICLLDFSVMSMQISDTLNVTRVDFPTRDMAPNCAIRAYLVWDDDTSQGRYFVIDAKGDKTTELAEITEDYKRLGYGAAPVEGAELQTVLDLVKKSAEEQN